MVDSFKEIGNHKYSDNEKAKEIFNNIADDCADVSGADNCELSFNLIKCMNDAAAKRGLDLKKELGTK